MIGCLEAASSATLLERTESGAVSAHHQVDPQARDTPGRAPAAAARAAGRATDLVMLDFDGVLADTRERFCAAMAAGFERLGRRDLASPDRVLALLDDNWFDALTREGLSAADRAVLDDAYKAGLRPYETLPAFPGVAAAVARIARRCPVVVITSGRTEVVNAFLSAHGIDGVRQTVGSDVETSKVRKIGHAIAEYQPARPWLMHASDQ